MCLSKRNANICSKVSLCDWRHSRQRGLSQVRRIEPTAGHKQAGKQIEVEVRPVLICSASEISLTHDLFSVFVL